MKYTQTTTTHFTRRLYTYITRLPLFNCITTYWSCTY